MWVRGSHPCQKRKGGAPTVVFESEETKKAGHPPFQTGERKNTTQYSRRAFSVVLGGVESPRHQGLDYQDVVVWQFAQFVE